MAVVAEPACGPLAGREEDGVLVFRGIPYAEPPIGDRRFRPPEPHAPWREVRDAGDFGPIAPQVPGVVQTDFWGLEGEADEDCLTLNVWTPGLDSARRPVMVWIHGGAFVVGAARRHATSGANLCRRGDVVVVTLNYRLGALGFLQLDDVGGESYAASGNHGLLDQIRALEWVRDHIAAFGGDPGNVTLFGESAGSISTSVLLAVPRAEGLFHRAITQSGGASIVRRPERSRELAAELMERAGARTVAELRALPAAALVAAQSELRPRGAEQLFAPVADDVVVPQTPMERIARGAGAQVALLSGTNLDEYRYWLLTDPRLPTLRPRHLHKRITQLRPGDPAEVEAAYRRSRPGLDDNQVAIAVVGDIAFRMPQIRMAEARAEQGAKTWMYLFTRPSPVQDGRLGAAHAMEIPFVFGNLDAPHLSRLIGPEPERPLSELMQDAWLAFARHGDPAHEGIGSWPAWDAQERATFRFAAADSGLDFDPLPEERRVWDGVPFTWHA